MSRTATVLNPPFVAPVPTTVAPPPAPADRVSRGTPRTAAAPVPGDDVWARLRSCESPSNGGTRYRGYYQFSASSWATAGGTGDPAAASLEEQTARAQYLAAHTDPAHQWPVCWRRANRA
jgi:resuscitation-promoting factor RpfB